MAITLDQLPARLRQIGKEFEAGQSAVVQFAAQAGDDALVQNTPIDTGEAISNWVATLDAPFAGTIPAYAPAPKRSGGGGLRSANERAAQSQARAVIRLFDVGRNRAIFIANNTRHIGRLNAGSSAQAPAGFVQIAVQSAVARVRSIRSVTALGRRRGRR